jgi:hypothetical protein
LLDLEAKKEKKKGTYMANMALKKGKKIPL